MPCGAGRLRWPRSTSGSWPSLMAGSCAALWPMPAAPRAPAAFRSPSWRRSARPRNSSVRCSNDSSPRNAATRRRSESRSPWRADNRAQSELTELLGQSQRAGEAALEAEARLRELDARLASEAELEIGQVSAELTQVRQSLAKLEDRAERLIVRAPVAGRIKDLKAKTPGIVVAPGMLVAEIVPQDQRLLVEARLSPRDVGHAKPGQPVSVKVETY